MLISTSQKPSESLLRRAKLLADSFPCKWAPRHHFSIDRLRQEHGETDILILTEEQLVYYHQGVKPLFFHPSTSIIRIKRMERGEVDPLVRATQAEPGDDVLDCTAGLASDSIVLSYAVGERGKVISLESEATIYVLIREGLKSYESQLPILNASMRRIEVRFGEHLPVLKSMPDASVDIVYFDPMFREPLLDSSSIAPLRSIANHAPLLACTIEEARRVARKTVVMKEHRSSVEFQRLGFTENLHSASNIAYGVIKL